VATKLCPFCKSSVAWDATVCPKCTRDIDTVEEIARGGPRKGRMIAAGLGIVALLWLISALNSSDSVQKPAATAAAITQAQTPAPMRENQTGGQFPARPPLDPFTGKPLSDSPPMIIGAPSPAPQRQLVECKVKPFGESRDSRAAKVFGLIIDRQQRRITECYGSSNSIITNEFSETAIVALCPILGGTRSFKINRFSGSVVATEEVANPPSSRTYSGECEIIGAPGPAPPPERKLILRSFMDSPHETHVNDVSYEMLAKFPDSYSNSRIITRGKVIQAIDDGTDVVMRVNVTADQSYRIFTDTVYVEYHRGFPSGERIIEADIVEFAGEFLGIKSYRSVMGATIQIPFVKSDSARVVGTTRKNN
jgi:hypothetical protein